MTTTAQSTIKSILDLAPPDELADALRLMGLGTMLTPLKRTFTGLTAAAAIDITTIDGSGETVGAGNGNRLPCLVGKTLRVTASGTAASVGSYILSDTGGTPTLPTGGASAGVGIATLSDDGKTVTFPNTITAFVMEYVPQSKTVMTTAFPPAGI